jgi:hypothetical protein
MSAQSKQFADLIRHRELNALRRLMVGRQIPAPSTRPTLPPGQKSPHTASHALSTIDKLEVQMNQLLLERSIRDLESREAGFLQTQIVAFKPTQAAPNDVIARGTSPSAPQKQAPEQVTLAQAADWFASNRMSDVQALLTQALGAQGALHDHVPTWLALFDFYRATDQAQLFDGLALDFSVRFGRSTPSWISFAALAKHEKLKSKGSPQNAPNSGVSLQIATCDWTAPSYLAEGALAGFDVLVHNAALHKRSLHLDWRGLVAVDPAQWSAIKNQLNTIASHNLNCVMYGLSSFKQACTTDLPEAMLAHLSLLRCQNQAEAFEELAIDYCVAFEVSPPDWNPPVCQLESKDSPLSDASAAVSAGVSKISAQAASPMADPFQSRSAQALDPATDSETDSELMGEVESLSADWLAARTSARTAAGQRWVIRCDKLVRIGPQATQELLAWLKTLTTQGLQVELKDTHRLIAAYFLAQGLYEFAKISIRKD